MSETGNDRAETGAFQPGADGDEQLRSEPRPAQPAEAPDPATLRRQVRNALDVLGVQAKFLAKRLGLSAGCESDEDVAVEALLQVNALVSKVGDAASFAAYPASPWRSAPGDLDAPPLEQVLGRVESLRIGAMNLCACLSTEAPLVRDGLPHSDPKCFEILRLGIMQDIAYLIRSLL